jgi:hypothetical protein
MVSEAQVRQLSTEYMFRDRDTVLAFLDRYLDVVEALLLIHGRLLELFPHAKISLQVVHDHEATDQDKLVAFIGTPVDTAENARRAIRTLLDFIVKWRKDTPDVVQQRLGLNLELQSSKSLV